MYNTEKIPVKSSEEAAMCYGYTMGTASRVLNGGEAVAFKDRSEIKKKDK